MKDNCSIPIEPLHMTPFQRLEAAEWAIEQFGQGSMDRMRPMSKKVVGGPNPCNEIMLVPCFWFEREEHANWFTLRWL